MQQYRIQTQVQLVESLSSTPDPLRPMFLRVTAFFTDQHQITVQQQIKLQPEAILLPLKKRCTYFFIKLIAVLLTRVGSKYICYDQLQIQLGQIKYIAFPDFNSNTNFQYKYIAIFLIQIQFNYIYFFQIWFKYAAHVFIIVQMFIVGGILSLIWLTAVD